MTNLIYQYWDGELNSGAIYGAKVMKEYADRIGAEYLFEHNPRFRTDLGSYSAHYGQFKIVYDDFFAKYDKVLFADTDVFPIDGLVEDVFAGFEADLGICTEPYQPEARLTSTNHINSANDERWADAIWRSWGVSLPRTEKNLLKVYNSGVVLYTKHGIAKMRDRFMDFGSYTNFVRSKGLPDFYASDQGYLHAMMGICSLDYIEMDNGWNSYVHYIGNPSQNPRPVNDMRNNNTKFVHVQLRGADHYDASKLWRVTNQPVNQWAL